MNRDNKEIVNKVRELVMPTVESLGYDLVEVEYTNEYGKWILRLYIDVVEGRVGLGDCEKVSHAVSALLDVEDVIAGKYNLEISSPGLERPLRREKDFAKYVGSLVKIRTFEKINEQKNFKGIIKGAGGGVITLAEETKTVNIPIDNIYKARLQNDSAIGGKKDG